MPRYKLTIEYDGTRFYGWQYQDGLLTVQSALQLAFQRMTSYIVLVEGAGRTDRGVHATGQVAHVDLPTPWDPLRLREGLNFYLQDRGGVSVIAVEHADSSFHARFSARVRGYEYVILNRRAPSPLEQYRMWHVKNVLDIQAMIEGANHFIGYHDFSAFRSSECQAKVTMRSLDSFLLKKEGDLIRAHIEARSFLHNQVRIMIGTLKKIGSGAWQPSIILNLLMGKQRIHAGPTAPPHGLYLRKVLY